MRSVRDCAASSSCRREVELVPWGSLQRSEYKSKLVETTSGRRRLMQKLQSQGVHHITLVGADRQTSIDFWEGLLGHAVRLRAAEPRQRGREPPLLRSGRRPADHRLHERGPRRPTRAAPRPTRAASTTSRSRSRRRRSTRRSSASRSAGSSTAASRTAASWTRSTSTTRSGSRSSSPSYRFEPPLGFTHADVLLEAHKLRVARGDHHIAQVHLADAIEDARPALARVAVGRPLAEEPVLTRQPRRRITCPRSRSTSSSRASTT